MINWLPKEDVGSKINNLLVPLVALVYYLDNDIMLDNRIVKNSKEAIGLLREIAEIEAVRGVIPNKKEGER